ncbi:RTX protein [Vibrio cholerae]|nr:MARTX multifunctional-autoprocessing repeats-in-toxin holotoxin RtxA [Vibrio cholerae]KFE11632.1 RTX toxin RtxA [Vibrio cholerae]GIB78530.1 RTX protein [Vibrio cholerae]
MGKPFWRSVEYFFTGNYSADDGNNNIVAIGFGGQIHAYGGDDHVTVGSIGATVYTGSGNDTVVGGSAYLKVEDSTGHLTVKGAAGYADINKSGDGNVSFAGAAGGVSIDHLGNHGDVSYGGAAAYNGITRKGLSGNVTFAGAGGYNAFWHETNQGNLSFTGAGAGNKLDRTWFNRYQGSHGDVTFDGAGAANTISSRVETGNITFRGAGADNHLVRKGKVGDITLQGAGASNRIERTHQAEDVYTQTRGNIRFEGVGGYNSLYSDVAHGDIHFSGGGAYNTIIRKGSGNDFAKEGMTNAKADEIVLTKAVMSGSWIGQDHHVTAVKSASEPNTYIFAFADSTYTKINKVQLRNDPQTGELKYYSTAWYKEGNHLSNLANQDISDNGGFTAVNINGAYTLSDLKVEHQQSVTVHAVEKSLTEYEWVTYANGAVIDAKEVSLSDAKMGGHAIYADGTKVDVKAVKSNRQPNTYIYAKVLGPYTKIVVVELANDPETGALKYQARSWYKEGDHTANIANQDISSATGYNPMGKGGYSLSDLHYSVNAVRSTSETVADIEEYTDQTLFKPANDSGESSGDVRFNGAGGGNVIKSNVTRGNVHFNGGGIANVILHSSQFGNTEFNGGGAANVIVKSGEEGDLTFRGAGLANVLVHQSQQGKMDVYAGGAVNVLVRLGDGQYLAHLLAYGNISVQKGSGDSRVVMLGGYNTHTQIDSGNGLWLAAGGFNVMTQVGQGDVAAVLAGGANVLTKMGEGELTSGMLGGANVITHISNDDQLSNTTAVALGGANILTKKGKGNTLAVMGGGANVLTHVGDGTTTGVMVGGANILTKIGNGDTTGIMLGVGNVLTHVGDGQTLGVMGAAGNIFTKVGDGTSIAVMIGAGNIFTHVGEGNAWALMGGLGNVFTKVGNGDALALMVAEANVFTHIGDGMSVALMLAKGNVATKVGNGTTLAAMVGNANIFTHIGHGSTFAAMIGQANIMTKVGNDLTAALMVGKANIMTHVGDGTSLGLFAGEVNVMTKVGNGTTLAAMFGKANIMTHVGDGLTGVLALGEANIVTKVGDDFMGVVAAAKANVVTHVGDATTAAVLAGKGNILTKVGEGTTVGLLISDVGNVMTHVGDGTTIGIAKGKANLITKVGDGLGVNVAWGQANVFTQVGDGDRYNFAKGEANLITKVGDGQEVSVVQGEANIITHVGNGDDYTGAWGKANVITKVGNGQNVVLAKGEANLSAKDLAKDGKGIDIAGLNKVHQAIEQHLSPVSATLYIWKPSDHSALGHAALQIGQGRTQLEGQAAADFNQQNYVSWWPLGSKSSNISNILNVATKDQPDLKLRWSDFSQPAHQNDTLEHDVASEENDGFGLHDGDIKLKRFIEKLNAAKGIDASFKEASEGYASVLLGNPDMLETTGIPAHVFQPFVEQWNDTSYDMMDVANRFAQELRLQAQRSDDPELLEKRIGNVVRQFAERALEEIETFKASQADQGRVFRINLEGLDVAAMQAEWHRLRNDPDARYQLLTKNCSSTVAKVLKAGGADKLIGHTWLPKFGVWTPTELFNFAQALQEAQLEIAAKKQSHQVTDVLDALSGNEKPKENVAIENDGTPPRDKESLSPLTRFLNNELYGDKEARRKIGEITQTLLDHAVEKGESQKITLQGEAGRLTGYYHQGTAPREGETSTTSGKVVLFLHGSGSSAEEQASAIRNHYQKQGIDMLAVNLRGYGESDGGPSEKGLYQDARTMFNYLVNDKGIDPSNIIIHGYSMGGPIAADLARYAAQNGQAVSGLLLDRPMPSMTKAITAHEVANPAGIVGAIAKAVNGQFSVEKNLEGLPKETSILLLTDNEGLGNEGEKLRTKLTASGYNVTGEQTFYGHEASNRLMSQYADQIVSGLSSSASVDEDLDQQGLDTTSTKDQGVSNKDDHLQVVDSKEALADGKILHNQDVNGWGPITVTPTTDGGETRFDGQIIVQMENDDVVAKAAANLAGKHPESSVVVQLDSDGNYRVVYGDPSKLDGKLRWQLVGHGRDHSESNNTRLSGYSADELAVKLAKFQQSFNQAENINNKPDHISIVGCSLVSDDKQKGFGHQFINAMDANGLRVDVSVRSSELAVDEAGRKHTKDANGYWVQKAENNKVSLSWDAQGEVVAKDERIRNGIAEGDIDLSRIGVSDVDEPARGAIGDNSDVFDAPEKRKPETEVIANSSSSNQLSYSGNIQVNVGEGEFTAVNWGTSNVGIKVGTGGFKSLAFGDNNVMVHIGDGESKHSVDIGGYQALEGAQMFLGNRNVSFNFGHSNDLILMMDKSIPTPPLVNPFDGAARISGVLQGIAMSGEGEDWLAAQEDWLAAQEQQWTLSGAKKFVKDMSGLDQSSSVDYTTLVELDSQNERDSRGLKHDVEATLNKQYNQWLSGNGNSGTSQLSRADKLRQANEKLAFNFAVGGQGADIQVTTGNWNFMFGDNIQSILDTNLGSLFGLMTQQFTATGQAKTTFTYTPQDLPRQLKNKLLGQLAGVGAETTLADIFGVDYTASGQIVSRNGQAVDGVVILKEMLEVIGEFSGDQLQAFVDPAKLLDSLKAGIDMGADGIKSFAETHGLKEKAPEEEKDNSSVSVNGANVNSAQGATMADGNTETAETQDRALGFNSLNLPNLFATIFSQDKQKEMKSLVENLKQNLTADLLNMKEKTFDFLRNSGHLQGDGDINISLGNYNFNWGGDGKDLGAYLGDNNNFWGGRGDDVFYATGTSNIFTGGEGHDMGVLMGRENMMFGGDGNDTAVVAGRINHVFLGAGDDQSFVFGEGGEIDTGSGRDYVVTSGNFNRVDTGDDQDYSVTIGNNNQVELGAGNDFANVFGNYNRINAGAGNDVVKLMGYHAVLNGGDGDDHLTAAAISKFSQFNGGEGRDLMVLGGYQNTFKGGTDVDSFVVSGDVIDNLVEDIRSEDNIVFNGIDWQKLWFERSGYDLKLSILRDPSNDSDQSKFEHIGSVTFSDYFNGNRAQVVIGMSDKDLSGEREYTMLSDSAIDALVQAMSGFEPQAGDNGFIDSLESKSQAAISMAWSDVVHKKGLMV